MMMIFHFHVLRFSLDSHLINQGPVKTESCTSILYLSLSPSRLPRKRQIARLQKY